MLTTDEGIGLDDYVFKSSPESFSDTDYLDVCSPSEDDFKLPPAADLDLLEWFSSHDPIGGSDEINNKFYEDLDQSVNEVLAQVSSPRLDRFEDANPTRKCYLDDFTLKSESEDFTLKNESDESSSSDSNPSSFSSTGTGSDSNKNPAANGGNNNNNNNNRSVMVKREKPVSRHCYLADQFLVPDGDGRIVSNGNKNRGRQIKIVNASRVPIQPKRALATDDVKLSPITVIKNEVNPLLSYPAQNGVPSKVIVLDGSGAGESGNRTGTRVPVKCTTLPVSNAGPVLLGNGVLSLNVGLIDPKVLKRQQRKIKNRESACLSRKKKKDYLTSLEDKVKDLETKNRQLLKENDQLKERLSYYESNTFRDFSSRNIKTGATLCMLLFVVFLNVDFLRFSNLKRTDIADVGAGAITGLSDSPASNVVDRHSRNLLWTPPDPPDPQSAANSSLSVCPANINQTESARLVLELERWIQPELYKKGNASAPVSKLRLRLRQRRKKLKLDHPIATRTYNVRYGGVHTRELEVFSPTPDVYSEFFEAINRQDDTYYVVSFSEHHMLLPALSHNKTRRPKMSLIMPSLLGNGNPSRHSSLMPLMQIDCEVLDTRLIHVKPGSIPKHLRERGNATGAFEGAGRSVSNVSAAANVTKTGVYKPYFIRNDERGGGGVKQKGFYNLN